MPSERGAGTRYVCRQKGVQVLDTDVCLQKEVQVLVIDVCRQKEVPVL